MSKSKKSKEQQYIMSPINNMVMDYRVYVMNGNEKLTTFLLSVIVGGITGLSFFSGFFKTDDGIATNATHISNAVVFVLFAIIGYIVYRPMRVESLMKKRTAELTSQFRSFLSSLSIGLSSGLNVMDSFSGVLDDLRSEFADDAYIVNEVKEMIDCMQHNVAIEDALRYFGERSGVSDIESFASVFAVCNQTGGNLKDVVRRTSNILGEKIEIAGEIETTLSSNKGQFNIMMVIPIVMMVLLRLMSSSFAESFATPAGAVAISIAIGLFIAAYKLGNKIMDIKG